MPTRHRAILILSALCLLAVGSFMLALMVGSFKVAPADVLATLLGQEGSGGEVVIELRLPRAIAGFACGGLLALAGALMQVLLRNPLADYPMTTLASLGDWQVLLPAIALGMGYLAWRRRWMAVVHWLLALAFGLAAAPAKPA